MEHNLELGVKVVSVVMSILFAVIGYGINIHCFRKVILPLRLSSNSSEYASENGEIIQLLIDANHGSGSTDFTYGLNVGYSFKVDGARYEGSTTLAKSNLYRINDMIDEIKSVFPDQIFSIRIWDRKTTLFSAFDFDETKTYLKGMQFDYKPFKATSPALIYYEIKHPENSCLSLDAKMSTIVMYIVGLLIGTALGTYFLGHFIPFEKTNLKVICAVCIMLTAIVPGYFMKSKLSNQEKKIESLEKNYWIYNLVVDQNNSEASLREQLRQQKLKYQNEL
jgi:hypothetical protein